MSWRVIVHAGVDTEPTDAVVAALRDAAGSALEALDAGQPPVDAAVAAVTVLEDTPALNAGVGSVLNADGIVEADAGVVDGADGRFAAVAALSGIRNPVRAAAALLESRVGPVLLVGDGARRFALGAGLEEAELVTAEQRRIWRDVKDNGTGSRRSPFTGRELSLSETVGAIVASGSASGSVAAAASTGGVLMKLPGRVGDSAIHGAGIYADADVALLCSGQGEATIELNLGVRVAAHRQAGAFADALRWGVELGHRHKGMRGGIVGYDRPSDTVAAVTNASSFPILSATAEGDTLVSPLRLDAA